MFVARLPSPICHAPGDEKSAVPWVVKIQSRGEAKYSQAGHVFPRLCLQGKSSAILPRVVSAIGNLAGFISQRASPCVRTSPFSAGKTVSCGIAHTTKRKGSSTAGSDRREVSRELQNPRAFLLELRRRLRKEEGAACSNAILINHIAKKGNQRKSFKLQMARLGN